MVESLLASLGPWTWIIIAAVLMALELAAPGAFMIWLGFAAAATGILAFVTDLTWPIELLIFAILATVLCLVVAVVGHDLGILLYPVVFLLGICTVGFGAIFFTMISEFGGRTGAGTASALGSTVSMIGSILGPPAFGLIVDVSGSYRLAWLSLVVFGAIAVAALLMVREGQQEV